MTRNEKKALAERLLQFAAEYEKLIGRAKGIGQMVMDMRAAAAELTEDV